MNKKVNYLIVGQGLAGTFLAFELLKQNKKIAVIDQGHKNSSSMIAAGLINPLVLKRLTLTWRADEFLSYNSTFYNELEVFLGGKYHFKMPIKKLIASNEEKDFWIHRFQKAELGNYMEKDIKSAPKELPLAENFQLGKLKQTSWVNISQLLIDFRAYLKREGLLIEESFNYALIKNQHHYKNIDFEKVLFCEGAMVQKNPFFYSLPFSLNKGQLMTINSPQLNLTSILKKKVFVLPIENGNYKVGATYSWKWKDEEPEKSQTGVLQAQLKEMLEVPYKTVKLDAGIRPAVKDRRPLIGAHHVHENYYLFNGMGSRGCFMAPLLASELVQNLEEGRQLHPEVLLNRYLNK